MIEISGDVRPIADQLAALGREAPRAITRGLNRGIARIKTLVIRALADDTGLPNKEITKSVGTTNATFSRPYAMLVVTGRRIPLIKLDARQTQRGVSYAGRHGRAEVRGAFIATMRSGHRGVYRRFPLPSARTSPGGWSKNLPITELEGPSLARVITRRWDRGMTVRATEVLQEVVQHEVSFLLRGQRIAGAEA